MNAVKLQYSPSSVAEAVLLAEAHLRVLGHSQLSPVAFVRENSLDQAGELVTASIFPNTKLRASELLPGLKLRSGSSILEVVRLIPTNKEVVYKSNRGGLYRMPSEKFVKLALQQGYRKVWNLSTFLMTLKTLLKPVLDAIPLMWVLRWVVNMVRKKPKVFADKLPTETKTLKT